MIVGFLLDLWWGDPQTPRHPVRLIGRLIAACERRLRRAFPSTRRGERTAGAVLVLIVSGVSAGVPAAALCLCARVGPWLALLADALLCWLLLATRSLWVESMRVHDALEAGDLILAREKVSRIVGRDTADLDASRVAGAAVETVAESAVDGIVSPLWYIALGFSPLGFFYKAVNTMDSMVGYKNDRYRYFGTAAARLDDALNFFPARIGGVLMCAAAFLCGLDAKEAFRIFLRDRRAHESPNSAHTEAAMAGALGLTLGGDACYLGRPRHKPTQGDGRPARAEDILRANRLTRCTAFLALAVGVLLRMLALWMGGIL